MKSKAVMAKPVDGGRLMPARSGENIGLANYRIKREFRRVDDIERRCEGHELFRPKVWDGEASVPVGNQAYPAMLDGEPVIQVKEMRQANGDSALLACTRTKIWRHFTFGNGLYVESGYVEDGYVEEVMGDWIEIGSGFSASAKRWEIEVLGNRAIFNNGVDLPVVYNLHSYAVEPLHELRAQGVAWVSHLAELYDILLLGGIAQFRTGEQDTYSLPLTRTYHTASQSIAGKTDIALVKVNDGADDDMAGNVLTTVSGPLWNTFMVGFHVRVANGLDITVSRVVDPFSVEFEDVAQHIPATGLSAFRYSDQPSNYLVTATQNGDAPVPVTQAWEMDGADVILKWLSVDGVSYQVQRRILPGDFEDVGDPVIGDGTVVSYREELPAGTVNYQLVPSYTCFTPDMVGQTILWDSGETREILEYIDPLTVRVGEIGVIPAGTFSITNPNRNATITDTDKLDIYRHREFWSRISLPEEYAASVGGAVLTDTRYVLLDQEAPWLKVGDSVLIVGGGVNGGNLTTTVDFIIGGRILLIGDAATILTPAEGETEDRTVLISKYDAIGSIVGYQDLGDDGHPIVAQQRLQDQVVVYKDNGIYLGEYIGAAGEAFRFSRVHTGRESPKYRDTLVAVNDDYQMYAGADRFWRFDLVSRKPELVQAFEDVRPIFYEGGDFTDPTLIFGFDNKLTREVWWCFPGTAGDHVLRYDYVRDTLATGSGQYTAGAIVQRPVADGDTLSELWCVLGTADGKLLRYGLVNSPEVASSGSQINTAVTAFANAFRPEHVGRTLRWDDGTHVRITDYESATEVTVHASGTRSGAFTILPAMWARDGASYTSILRSGEEDFRHPGDEKMIHQHRLIPGTHSADTPLTVKLLAGRSTGNLSEEVDVDLTNPVSESTIPCRVFNLYFADQIEVAGNDNPLEIVAREVMVGRVMTAGLTRLAG